VQYQVQAIYKAASMQLAISADDKTMDADVLDTLHLAGAQKNRKRKGPLGVDSESDDSQEEDSQDSLQEEADELNCDIVSTQIMPVYSSGGSAEADSGSTSSTPKRSADALKEKPHFRHKKSFFLGKAKRDREQRES